MVDSLGRNSDRGRETKDRNYLIVVLQESKDPVYDSEDVNHSAALEAHLMVLKHQESLMLHKKQEGYSVSLTYCQRWKEY